MNKLVASITLTITFMLSNAGVCPAREVPQIKQGIINSNEVWRGDLYVVGDVVISENVTVTIESGSRLNFANYDILNKGKDNNQCEIITYGMLDIQDPVKITAINDAKSQTLSFDGNVQALKFYPYQVDTEKMRQEFREFKNQYLILWALLYGMWILQR